MKKFVAILTQRGFKEVSTYEDMAGAIFVLFLFGALLLLVSDLWVVGTGQGYQLDVFWASGKTECVLMIIVACLYREELITLETYMERAHQDVSRSS